MTQKRGGWARKVRVIETGEVFDSAIACADSINGDYSHIYKVIKGERKSHKGLTFEYIPD